jgi:hypothetical protein
MDTLGHPISQRIIHEAMALHESQTPEARVLNLNAKMSATALGAFVSGVEVALIDDRELGQGQGGF